MNSELFRVSLFFLQLTNTAQDVSISPLSSLDFEEGVHSIPLIKDEPEPAGVTLKQHLNFLKVQKAQYEVYKAQLNVHKAKMELYEPGNGLCKDNKKMARNCVRNTKFAKSMIKMPQQQVDGLLATL